MFTGLIQTVCTVKSASKTGDAMNLSIDLGSLAKDTKTGDSIAISGVCLTVSKLSGNIVAFDVSSETLEKSTLGKLKAGDKVNIELSMKPSDRFGGHFVLGHVDGTAIIKSIEKHNQFADIKLKTPPELLEQMIIKGSVAVDGISLTIAAMDNESFTVAIIPETLKRTMLGSAKPGDAVNIETDIIVKTIKSRLAKILPQSGLTMEKLKEMGF
jgi:riboflavin synthase